MKRKLLVIMKNKWFLGSLLAIAALGVFGSQEITYMARQYMAGDTAWNPAPRELWKGGFCRTL